VRERPGGVPVLLAGAPGFLFYDPAILYERNTCFFGDAADPAVTVTPFTSGIHKPWDPVLVTALKEYYFFIAICTR
jgi:hypothetical protein